MKGMGQLSNLLKEAQNKAQVLEVQIKRTLYFLCIILSIKAPISKCTENCGSTDTKNSLPAVLVQQPACVHRGQIPPRCQDLKPGLDENVWLL